MRTKRMGMVLVPVTAAALAFTVVGYNEYAGAAPAPSAHAKSASAAPAKTPCLADDTTLVGKLDGDDYPDEISDPDHSGAKVTVAWGNADGSYGKPVSVNTLIGVRKGEDGAVAVADFHNKGKLDMLVSIVKPAGGDDPNQKPRVAELRQGPLNRDDLTSSDTTGSDLGKEGEVRGLAIAHYNDDDFPDVAIYHDAGDGQTERNVRLSLPDGGLDKSNPEANEKYGDWGDEANPPPLPNDGWSKFYDKCS